MARKVMVEEVSTPVEDTPKNFKLDLNEEVGVVKFELSDGTPVVMKSPKARQFLLVESFLRLASDDYKTEAFIAIKLASLCINKYGDKESITFEELLDNLEIEDLERVAEAISCFRDKLEYLARKSSSN